MSFPVDDFGMNIRAEVKAYNFGFSTAKNLASVIRANDKVTVVTFALPTHANGTTSTYTGWNLSISDDLYAHSNNASRILISFDIKRTNVDASATSSGKRTSRRPTRAVCCTSAFRKRKR